MKKMHLSILALLLAVCGHATPDNAGGQKLQSLVFDFRDGTQKEFLLADKPCLTFGEGKVVGAYLAAESSVMVGGLVGHMVGTLNKCSATIAKGDSVCGTATYSNVGALAGYVSAESVVDCVTDVEGLVSADCGQFISTTSEASAGGMTGISFGASHKGCSTSIVGKVKAYAVPETNAEESFAAASAGGMCGGYAADYNTNNTVNIKGDVLAEGCGTSGAGGVVGMQSTAGYGASGLNATISGKVSAVNHGSTNNRMVAYAGGVYGSVSFQYSTANLGNCSSNVSGEISAKAGVAAYVGGVAGSAAATVGDRTTITSTGKVIADAPSFATCGGVIGNVLGNSCACYSVINGTLSVSKATGGSQVGGVFGSIPGSKYARKTVLACYSLISGSVNGGEGSLIGAITGFSTGYSTPKSSYWWSGSDTVKSDTGANTEATDGKLESHDEASLKTAMEAMNTTITDNGSYTCKYEYNAETGILDLVSTASESDE